MKSLGSSVHHASDINLSGSCPRSLGLQNLQLLLCIVQLLLLSGYVHAQAHSLSTGIPETSNGCLDGRDIWRCLGQLVLNLESSLVALVCNSLLLLGQACWLLRSWQVVGRLEVRWESSYNNICTLGAGVLATEGGNLVSHRNTCVVDSSTLLQARLSRATLA